MIGIIPAAGKGERLGKKTKALVKVRGKPIIEHILYNFMELGIKKVYIIQHGKEIEKAVGDDYLNMALIYIQQHERKGLAHAITLARTDEDVCIILGDIVYKGSLIEMKKRFEILNLECLYGVKHVKDKALIKPSYGIKSVYPHKVVEKPIDLEELFPLLGLGIYMAKPSIFYYASKTKEFTNVLNLFPKEKCKFWELDGFYANINTPEDLEKAQPIYK